MDPRDQTFMTIHNLTPDANILFASDSIFDILGYTPAEVQGKSCFDYFHPEEMPFARSIHRRGVRLDKAASLHYARILARDGTWVNCECCFTIVHDVLVASTSIYLGGPRSHRRAMDAPQIRRLFSSSPRDPRYHMLEHLSPKFKMPPMEREPRAALILNRFTRNLSIMFATNAISSILGLSPDEIKDKPFYECIQENCLQDAIQCLESAKENESIAYLRFWYRDPRGGDEADAEGAESMQEERPSSSNSDSEGGGVELDSRMDVDEEQEVVEIKGEPDVNMEETQPGPSSTSISSGHASTSTSGTSTAFASTGPSAYQTPLTTQSTGSGSGSSSGPTSTPALVATCQTPQTTLAAPSQILGRRRRRPATGPSFELEAVVSCTSDGLVVVLRKARPPIPTPQPPLPSIFNFENGLFAAPWGQRPIEPYFPPEALYTFRPPLLPQYMPLRHDIKAAGGPPLDQLMRSIRDVAVFAWALVGINGNVAGYGQGLPRGGAQPPEGLPIWDPSAGQTGYRGPENLAAHRWTRSAAHLEQEGGSAGASAVAGGPSSAFAGRGRGFLPPAEPRVAGYGNGQAGSLGNYTFGGGGGSGSGSSQSQRPAMWSRPSFGAGGGSSFEFNQEQDRYQSPPPGTGGSPFTRSSIQQQPLHGQLQPNYLPPPSALAGSSSGASSAPPPPFHGLPQEPWAEASAAAQAQTYPPTSYAIPTTTHASSPVESSHDYRFLWR